MSDHTGLAVNQLSLEVILQNGTAFATPEMLTADNGKLGRVLSFFFFGWEGLRDR